MRSRFDDVSVDDLDFVFYQDTAKSSPTFDVRPTRRAPRIRQIDDNLERYAAD